MLEFCWDITSILALATTQTKDQMEGGFFLDVVVAESATIFQLLASKDQTLLIWWNALFVLLMHV